MNTKQAIQTVLLIGSYNGQDSLGDECLLRAACAQFKQRNPNVRLILHANDRTPLLDDIEQAYNLEVQTGFQSAYYGWRTKWRHTQLPPKYYEALAKFFFPLYWLGSSLHPKGRIRQLLEQLKQVDVIYLFGGTQFSTQWFELNAPHYFRLFKVAKRLGIRCYLGPQQYGPLNTRQQQKMRWFTRTLVTDFRTRHQRCLPLITDNPEDISKLTWDEVFSNRVVYPITDKKTEGDYILLNVRHNIFDEATGELPEWLEPLATLLKRVHGKLGGEYRYFQVSGESFCDDKLPFEQLQKLLGDVPLSLEPRFKTEYDLMKVAQQAKACLSMSFHGCLLSGMVGTPFVPMVSGAYYSHKYRDFGKYSPSGDIPMIHPENMGDEAFAEKLVQYVQDYDAQTAACLREEAARTLERYYDTIFGA